MKVEKIDDVSNEEKYIQDLETEVETLRSQLKLAEKRLAHKPKIISQEDYDKVCAKLQEVCREITPF